MRTYTLTAEGAADKLSDLYALSDPALALQAAMIAVSFKNWMKVNFDLTTEQEAYINGMSSSVAAYFGAQCSVCFLFRLPITLIYPAPPTTPGYGKWTGSDSTVKVTTNGHGQVEASGELVFTISYTLD